MVAQLQDRLWLKLLYHAMDYVLDHSTAGERVFLVLEYVFKVCECVWGDCTLRKENSVPVLDGKAGNAVVHGASSDCAL